jgi:hypothetical protein
VLTAMIPVLTAVVGVAINLVTDGKHSWWAWVLVGVVTVGSVLVAVALARRQGEPERSSRGSAGPDRQGRTARVDGGPVRDHDQMTMANSASCREALPRIASHAQFVVAAAQIAVSIAHGVESLNADIPTSSGPVWYNHRVQCSVTTFIAGLVHGLGSRFRLTRSALRAASRLAGRCGLAWGSI